MNTSEKEQSGWGQNLLTVVISLVIALGCAEVALRVIEPTPYRSHPLLGSIGNPGGEIDGEGFRNKTTLQHADIVAIGDSQTYGDNATEEEAWPQQLGNIATTSVYQMAWGGYGPMEYRYLLDKALKLNPKIVVTGFYLGNDLENAVHSAYQHDEWVRFRAQGFVPDNTLEQADDVRYSLQTGLPPDSWKLKFYVLRLNIRQYSRVYTLLGNSTRELREKIGLARTKEDKTKAIEDFSSQHPEISTHYDHGPISTILSPAYRADVVDLNNRNTQEGWRIAKQVFVEMASTTKVSGATFVLAVIPTKEYVYARYMQEKGELTPELRTYMDKENDLQKNIKAYCSTENINCVFTDSALVEALKDNIPIYPSSGNSHPMAFGYRIIAQAIAQAKVSKE